MDLINEIKRAQMLAGEDAVIKHLEGEGLRASTKSLRQRFSENAEQFDALMIEMLEENDRLRNLYDDQYLHNVRRTLERGLKVAQSNSVDSTYMDIFTHALDELKRAGLVFPET